MKDGAGRTNERDTTDTLAQTQTHTDTASLSFVYIFVHFIHRAFHSYFWDFLWSCNNN